MTDTGERSKRAAFEELLNDGVTALHFDPRPATVRVPKHLKARPWLVLNYSYRYRLEDFTIDDEGVFASLSFGGRPFPCYVPWDVVFAVAEDAGDRMHLWQADMPLEALTESARRQQPPPQPALRAVPQPDAAAGDATRQPATEPQGATVPALAEASSPRPSARPSPAPAAARRSAPARPRSPFRVIEGGLSTSDATAEQPPPGGDGTAAPSGDLGDDGRPPDGDGPPSPRPAGHLHRVK